MSERITNVMIDGKLKFLEELTKRKFQIREIENWYHLQIWHKESWFDVSISFDGLKGKRQLYNALTAYVEAFRIDYFYGEN